MRIHCPACSNAFTVTDDLSEKQVSCPTCGQSFIAPALLTGSGEPPTYGVGPAEPRPAMFVQPQPPPPSDRPAAPAMSAPAVTPAPGVPGTHRIALSQKVIHWFGPIGLIVFFILSFFSWIVAAPAGYTVYSQSAWQIMTGGLSADIIGEEVMGREAALKEFGGSWLMALTLIPLLFAALLALTDLLEKQIHFAVPDAIQAFYRHRTPILTATALALFAFLTLQMLWGLGLESAAPAMAEKQVTQTFAKPPSGDENVKQKYVRELRTAEEIARLGVRRTWALWLAWWASAAAAAGYVLESALVRRGNRPPPAIEFSW